MVCPLGECRLLETWDLVTLSWLQITALHSRSPVCSSGCIQGPSWLKCCWLKRILTIADSSFPQLCDAHQNHGGVATAGPRQQNVPGLSSYHPWASGAGRHSGRNSKCICLSCFFSVHFSFSFHACLVLLPAPWEMTFSRSQFLITLSLLMWYLPSMRSHSFPWPQWPSLYTDKPQIHISRPDLLIELQTWYPVVYCISPLGCSTGALHSVFLEQITEGLMFLFFYNPPAFEPNAWNFFALCYPFIHQIL